MTFLVTIQKGVMKMIKKTFDKYSLSQKKKDALFERINMSVTNTATEETEEKENNKSGFMRYAAIAASVVLLTGITMLIVHFATPGQQIDVSTPQNNVFESNLINASDSENTSDNKKPKPEIIDALSLPFYKDSAVMDMEPQKYGSEGMEQVRFAEVISNVDDYRYVVAGDFIRREEDRYEAIFNLYIYKGKELIGVPGRFDIGAGTLYVDVTKADMEQLESKLLKVHIVWQDDKTYPLIMLTHKVNKQVLRDLFYSDEYEYGTIFFSVKDEQAFRITLNGGFNICYPDFEMKSFSKNVYTDKNGWVTQFDFKNKKAYVDAVFYDPEKQERLDSLLPFEDRNIPVYDGEMYLVQGMDPSPFADILIDEKTCGDYTFTLVSPMAKRTDMPDKYMTRWFHLIVSYKGKVLKDSYSAAVFDGAQYGMAVPKDYDFSSMLKVYTMKQNGIEYPLASVTYTDPEHLMDAGIKANSITRFFTVRNGMGEWFADSSADYKNLPSDVEISGLSIKDSVNLKRITFDFENRKATVTELNDAEDIDIRQCPYYKDSEIYKNGTVGESEFVRFAEKEYVSEGKNEGRYNFIVGGKMERIEDGAFSVSLNMYLYRNDSFVSVQNAISNGGFDFTVSAEDIENFGDTVLDLKEFKYFGTPYPLAVVTAKPHSSILENEFPSAGITTISNFFTVRHPQNTDATGPELALFYNGGTNYPDYTKNVTFRISENDSGMTVMVDEKCWEVFFNPETLTASVSRDKAYSITIKIDGEGYAEKPLLLVPLSENSAAIPFTTDKSSSACFSKLDFGKYTITDEDGNSISATDNGSFELTEKDFLKTITVKAKKFEIDTTAENVTLQFTGDSSYTNRGLLYLIKTDKAFLDGTDKLTYTDKDLSTVPSYSVSADGKIVLGSADVGYYIVTGPMFLPTNAGGFTVFEITAKDDNGTVNVDLNKADIGADRIGMAEPEPVDPDECWLDGQYEFCMQDITYKDVVYSAISIGDKWEQLENADGAYPYKINGDVYEEEIHKARQKNYSEACEIYYNGIIYTGKEVYDNFVIREVKPGFQFDYWKTILYIRKDLKTEGNDIYTGSGFRSVNYGHDDVALKDIKLKVEGIDKKPEDFHDVWVIVLNELEVYMHRNNLNVDGYTDNFHYRDFVDGLSINENCELVIPDDYPHTGIASGYTVIGVTRLVKDEYGSGLEFEEKLPVYFINSDGSAEFSFWIEKNMFA